MGRPKKDPAQVRSVPLNFRVSSAVKDAIDAMVARRAAETGDDSITGWFLAMVHREAKRADIAIATAPEAKPAPVKPSPAKKKRAPAPKGTAKRRAR